MFCIIDVSLLDFFVTLLDVLQVYWTIYDFNGQYMMQNIQYIIDYFFLPLIISNIFNFSE